MFESDFLHDLLSSHQARLQRGAASGAGPRAISWRPVPAESSSQALLMRKHDLQHSAQRVSIGLGVRRWNERRDRNFVHPTEAESDGRLDCGLLLIGKHTEDEHRYRFQK